MLACFENNENLSVKALLADKETGHTPQALWLMKTGIAIPTEKDVRGRLLGHGAVTRSFPPSHIDAERYCVSILACLLYEGTELDGR